MEISIFSDMNTIANAKLAEKQVSFQGTEIALNEITPAVSPLAKLLPLNALMERKRNENFRFQSSVGNTSLRAEQFVVRLTVRLHSNSSHKLVKVFD